MLDSALVANGIVDYLNRGKLRGVIIKLDFEKAYDFVDWEFLMYIMRRLGFNSKLILWIKSCLEPVIVSLLVNRSPTKVFSPKKGFRQGNPLAPFLFLIVVERFDWVS